MKCERRDVAIAKLVGGDLSRWRAATLQRHLDTCPRCDTLRSDLAKRQIAVRNAERSFEANRGDVIADAVFARVDARRSSKTGQRFRRRAVAGVLTAIVLLAAVVLQFSTVGEDAPPQVSKVSVTESIPSAVLDDDKPLSLAESPRPDVIIRIETQNPDIVIYWHGDSAGG